ncbi:hypothetical protein KKHLCK_08570 [Candidatus Electrothrix laxa]
MEDQAEDITIDEQTQKNEGGNNSRNSCDKEIVSRKTSNALLAKIILTDWSIKNAYN